MANPIDQVISKGTGLAHEMKVRLDGLVGVFGTLAEQHGEAGALLRRAKAADVTKRADLWSTIRASLLAHEQGELHVVYPALRQYAELRPFAERHEEEASRLSQTISQMDAVRTSSQEFAVLLDRLIGLIDAHAAEEEKQIFPKAQNVIGDARARELDGEFVVLADRVKQSELPPRKH